MKKLQPFILFLLFSTAHVWAQLDIVGSNEYGRIFDITYDETTPGKLYAATMGNHLVVSEDNGSSWYLFYSFPLAGSMIKDLKPLPGNKLAFTVNNPNGYHNTTIVVFDATSPGIVHTYEIPIPDTATSSYISAYDIYASDTDFAIVQQYYEEGFSLKAKVYYTTDAGNSWSEIYNNSEFDFIFPANVAISPDNNQKLFIARMGGLDPEHIGGLLISQDAGSTWDEKLPGIDFKPMAFHPENPETILLGTTVGSQTQDLFRSVDGGGTWTAIDENWAETVAGAIITIKYNPLDPNNVIILAEKDIITSSDDLETLQFYHDEDGIHDPEGNTNYYYGTNASFNPFTAGEIFISANYFPLFTNDGGATVTRAKQPYFASFDLTSFVLADDQTHLYYGVQDGFVHKDMTTMEDTPAFVRSLASFSNWNYKFFTDQHVAGRIYIYASNFMNASLSISNDHGATFVSVPGSSPYIETIASKPGSPNLIWYSVSDGGGLSSMYELDITDSTNPQQEPVTLPENNFLTALYFNPSIPDEKWIAMGPNVYKSVTEAPGWELMSTGLEALENGTDRIFQIVQNPIAENEMALATSKGIFASQDSGTTWTQMSGFPDEGVHLIGYSGISDGQMVAVTYDTEFTGLALRYSADSGENWAEVPAENLAYTSSSSAAMQFGTDNATVYISTTDMGLISYSLNFTDLGIPQLPGTRSFAFVYPNPAADHLSLELKNESLLSAAIYSVTGQKIMESSDVTIDVSNFENGIYFVKIKTVSGKSTTQKFIKG